MKSALFFLAVVFFSACHVAFDKTIEGNANIQKQDREVNGFTGVTVSGPFQVTIQQGDNFSVSVEADENLMPYIETKKAGNALEISERDGYDLRGTKSLRVTVQLPEINTLSVAGTGNIQTAATLKNSRRLEIDIAGSGKIDAIIDAPEVSADITGSGTASLSGQTRKMDVGITGSGDFLAENLKSEECSVNIAGSGTARVFAGTSLNANISGSGDIYYAGKPQNVKKSVAGSGKIKEL